MARKIELRPTRDPGEKSVDLITQVEYVSTIVLDAIGENQKAAVSNTLIGTMRELRGRSKRFVDRDYAVWYGEVENHGEKFACIGLPERFDADLHIYYQRALRRAGWNIRAIHRYLVSDMDAEPILRWDRGRIIAYKLGLDEATGEFGPDVEERSCEIRSRPTRSNVRTPPAPATFRASEVHSFESWDQLRREIVAYVGHLTAPSSYAGLRRFVTEHCGIGVVEVKNAGIDSFAYGLTQAGWIDDDGCGVRVLIQSALTTAHKHAVLAHELAHYVLHFPILYLRQLIEQASWSDARFESAYTEAYSEAFPNPPDIEADASYFASYLLVPRWVNEEFASLVWEENRSPTAYELAWRFLQPLLAADDGQPGWQSLERVRGESAGEKSVWSDLNAQGLDDLYATMVAALAGRESAHSEQVRDSVVTGMQRLESLLQDRLDGSTMGAVRKRSDGTAAIEGTEISPARRVYPPLAADGRADRRFPIVPVKLTAAGEDDEWASPLAAGVASVHAWRREYEDISVVAYPYQAER
ncbi:ImmA/IrrE family metallo-endopeptidase [Cryptosporangium arvum]|uniref:ImmA/IrrE family metallo-endopeptidase n=1 Tax=Cryptosporangium arvum TaxID=80871 RepID=UPI0012ED8687|nr:hypothetical protein [Cryptosporangium arvum]